MRKSLLDPRIEAMADRRGLALNEGLISLGFADPTFVAKTKRRRQAMDNRRTYRNSAWLRRLKYRNFPRHQQVFLALANANWWLRHEDLREILGNRVSPTELRVLLQEANDLMKKDGWEIRMNQTPTGGRLYRRFRTPKG